LDAEAPRAIRIHVNAGKLPSDHWVHDPQLGGGRILGEMPHFLDLAAALAGSPIDAISGEALPNSQTPPDTLVSELRCRNGSIASIFYSSEGGNDRAKERIELHQHGRSFYLTDFKELRSIGSSERKERGKADKGHVEELERWGAHLNGEAEAPIPFEDLVNTTKASIALKEAIEGGAKLHVEGSGPGRGPTGS
jgi:predicted dehydrogenase